MPRKPWVEGASYYYLPSRALLNVPMILRTKLFAPPQRPEVVQRERILARLERGARPQQVCVLSAPAGFGKTTTVAQWLHEAQRAYAWLSLDTADNDAERFWHHLLAALQTYWAEVGTEARSLLARSASGASTDVLDALLNDLARQEVQEDTRPLVLVLDDYHVVRDPEIHRGVDYLLDHLPPTLCVVIATREDPPLSLPRRRARGLLTEVRAADLRFSTEETAAFLNDVMELALAPSDVEALERRTEGWIASLHLAALSLQGQPDPSAFIRSFAGSDRHVVDYLVEEVLAQQPDEVQAFLLATVVLKRFCAPLCEAVLKAWPDGASVNAHTMLERLERSNLFIVPLDGERRWYRYHALFADLLRMRLRRRYPERSTDLHQRASRWFEEEGLIDDAIGHALAAEDIDRAATLIEREGMTLITRFGRPVPGSWLRAVPAARIRERPRLAIVHAWSHLIRQPMLFADPEVLGAVEAKLQEAEAALSTHPNPEDEDLHRHIRMCRAHLARYRGDVDEAIARSQAALEELPPEPSLFRSGTALNLGLAYLVAQDAEAAMATFEDAERYTAEDEHYVRVGLAYMRSLVLSRTGRLRASYALCEATLRTLTPPDIPGVFPSYAGNHLIGLGRVLLEWNELEAAREKLRLGLFHMARAGDPLIEVNGRALLARVLQAQGETATARAELDRALQRLPRAQSFIRAVRSTLGLDEADAVTAPRHPDVETWAAAGNEPFAAVVARGEWQFAAWLARGRQFLARHRTAPLDDIEMGLLTTALDAQAGKAHSGGWNDRAIEVLVVLAVAYDAAGDEEAAQAALVRALRLGQAEGYVRRFVDEGPPMARLLYRFVQQAGDPQDPMMAYASEMLTAFPEQASPDVDGSTRSEAPPATDHIDPLTPRETEVLHLIAQGLTNQEIADKLFISYETVKVHARNIYQKLDVGGRTQAVARARGLGLLTSA